MLPIPPYPKYTRKDYEEDVNNSKKRLGEFCRWIPGGIDCEYSLGGGALPHLEIIKYADKKDVDLIVMGSHTKEKAGKWYSGSVVERVSFRSNCAVLVVTDPEVLLPWEDSLTTKIRANSEIDRSLHVFSKK